MKKIKILEIKFDNVTQIKSRCPPINSTIYNSSATISNGKVTPLPYKYLFKFLCS